MKPTLYNAVYYFAKCDPLKTWSKYLMSIHNSLKESMLIKYTIVSNVLNIWYIYGKAI